MAKKRKTHTNKFKATVVLEALKEESTLAELSSKYGVHSTQILRWKKQALANLPDIFSKAAPKAADEKEQEVEDLYKHIGQLKVELDWLKKKSGLEY